MVGSRPCTASAILLLACVCGFAGPIANPSCGLVAACADEPRDEPPIDFAKQIAPIFSSRCVKCHGPETQEAGVRFDHRVPALRGGDSGRVIVPGESGESELFRRVSSADEAERMPPDDGENEALSAAQIALLKRWIDQGAAWPDDGQAFRVKSDHWAYQPVRANPPPQVSPTRWARNPIDAFVLARLRDVGIEPSPEADRYTLIKRLHYDLVGLPPAIEDVEEFMHEDAGVAGAEVPGSPSERGHPLGHRSALPQPPAARSQSPIAFEKAVDRLLASPRFGERWGRHWLDKARYADSDGYEKDNPRPDAWRYRDWVIDAINADVPFDRFTIEQLAGDLLPDAAPAQKLATAFHRQTLTNTEGGVDQEQFRVEAVFDRVNTTATVWLGLTVACAQCHTHKYDQITQAEYYQLFAFFNNADETTVNVPASGSVAGAEAPGSPSETGDGGGPQTMSVRVLGQRTNDPRATRLLRRGDFLQPADPIEPGTLAVLHEFEPRRRDASPDRLDLACWLVDRENPLTPRVAVNHVWSHLFGHGLVRTMNDFGVRGERPTHPELLDWLAADFAGHFAADGSGATSAGRIGNPSWGRKRLIRLLVTSAAYRQSSHHRPELIDVDSQNALVHRQNRFRVEAETIRDIALAAGGLLSQKVGGPSVFPPLPPDIAALSYAGNFKWKDSEGDDRYRRGMYTFFKRTAPHPNLMTFDCPDANTAAVQRFTSNTPLMALTTLNNVVFVEAAQALARRLLDDPSLATDSERLVRACQLCVGRPPAQVELEKFAALLESARQWYATRPADAQQLAGQRRPPDVPASEAAAWVAALRVVLNLDEFITRE